MTALLIIAALFGGLCWAGRSRRRDQNLHFCGHMKAMALSRECQVMDRSVIKRCEDRG